MVNVLTVHLCWSSDAKLFCSNNCYSVLIIRYQSNSETLLRPLITYNSLQFEEYPTHFLVNIIDVVFDENGTNKQYFSIQPYKFVLWWFDKSRREQKVILQKTLPTLFY